MIWSLSICITHALCSFSRRCLFASWFIIVSIIIILDIELFKKWNVKTMSWLGEGCSSYEHEICLSVWCIKEWVNKVFSCLCCVVCIMVWSWCSCKLCALTIMWLNFEYYELLYGLVSTWKCLKYSKCHARRNVPMWGIL